MRSIINSIINKIKAVVHSREIEQLFRDQNEIKAKLELITELVQSKEDLKDTFWLLKNRVERMDASKSFFNVDRRLFHLTRYEFAAEYASGKNVVDIACGTGYGTEILAQKGSAANVVGVDISKEAVDYARRHHLFSSVEYIVASGDATGLPLGSFDLVVSFETLEHVSDDQAILAEFDRLLKPGGRLICSVPNDWPLEDTPCHVRKYDYSAFLALLEEHFDVVTIYNQNSGCDIKFNHGQPVGIVETTDKNRSLAECYLAVCRKPTRA